MQARSRPGPRQNQTSISNGNVQPSGFMMLLQTNYTRVQQSHDTAVPIKLYRRERRRNVTIHLR